MNKPIRIQRKRTKGWKMPPNTVYVGRPTKWGNPFVASDFDFIDCSPLEKIELAVQTYEAGLPSHSLYIKAKSELEGKNLACWCRLDKPCHADVLLRIANAPEDKNNV